MKVFLLNVLVRLVSATEEPLPISGNFRTIYLASKSTNVMGKNSEVRMLMHKVKFFENYTFMSMAFYVWENTKCRLHTVWADKSRFKFWAMTSKRPYITEEMWKEHVNLTRYYEIPVGNIQNVYEEDPCPKWEY